MNLRYKAALLMFLFGGFFIVSVAVTYFYYFKETTFKNAHQNTQYLADEAASHIESHLKERAKIAATLASSPLLLNALTENNEEFAVLSDGERKEKIARLNQRWKDSGDPNDPFIQDYMTNAAAKYLKKQQALFPKEYGEIFLTNRYGTIIATTNKLTTLAHAHKYWWLAGYAEGKGRIFFDDRGYDASVEGYVLGVVVPVMDQGRIIGIMKSNVNIMGPLSDVIEKYVSNKPGSIKLVRSKGLIVFEHDQEPLSSNITNPISKELGMREAGSLIFGRDGNQMLAAYTPVPITMGSTQYGFGGSFESIDHIKGNTGEGWNIVIIREAKEVLSPIAETIYKFGVIGGLFVLLAAFVAWFLGSRISRPIVQFAQSAKSLGAGNLDTTVDITSTDEIGDLAQSFNTMASNLKDTVISRDRLLTEVKNSLKEKEVLLQEIHHRVKNNMAVISSLLDLHMDQIQNQEAAAVLQDSQQRVRAMAMAHEELYRSKDLAHLKLSEYISNLVSSIEQLFGVVADRITIQTQVENLPVSMDQAIPLGLIINELVTNAMKHAFPEGRPGTITVSMESKEEVEIELMVADDGIGIPEELDWRNTDTMGLMIAVNLVQQIRGSIELDRSRGTCWDITFKKEAS